MRRRAGPGPTLTAMSAPEAPSTDVVPGPADHGAARDGAARRARGGAAGLGGGHGPAGRTPPARGVRCGPARAALAGGLGRARIAGPGRRRGLRLLPGRLPPGPRRPAGRRLEGLGPGAVGPRVEPGLPALPGRPPLGGRRHRRARRGGAVRAVPAPARPGLAPRLDRLSRPSAARPGRRRPGPPCDLVGRVGRRCAAGGRAASWLGGAGRWPAPSSRVRRPPGCPPG